MAIIFCGRLGEYELSAVVLATSVFNVTGLSFLTGFASAMETFTGQAYGARRYKEVGVVLQRAVILSTLLVALVAAAWAKIDVALVWLGQDAKLSAGARDYLVHAVPALWMLGVFESLKRYLMAQGVVAPISITTAIGLVASPLYNYLFVFHYGYGLVGASIAYNFTEGTLALCTLLYVLYRDHKLAGAPEATWGGWSVDCLHGWGEYMRFALPSIVMVCCEWWTFEALILMAGLLPDPATTVATMGIAVDTEGLQFMIISGVAMALSTRASNSLGASHPKAAYCATIAGIWLTIILEILICFGLGYSGKSWATIFTDAPVVITRTAALMPYLISALPGDGGNILMQGLLRGAGQQHSSALINILCYWGFGIPCAYYLGIVKGYSLEGLWIGLILTNTLLAVVMVIRGLTLDFERISDEVSERFAREEAARRALLAEEGDDD